MAAILLLLSILAYALAPSNGLGRFAALGIEGITLLFILRTSRAAPRLALVATVIVILALISALVLTLTHRAGGWGTGFIGAMIILIAPTTIVRRLLSHERITGETVAGAICLYLLAGLFFALAYAAIDGLSGGAFFAGHPAPIPVNYVYFSFVTISTVGYGDLTPAGRLGKLLAVGEAVGGQLYLVTIIAVLVANIGRSRPERSPR